MSKIFVQHKDIEEARLKLRQDRKEELQSWLAREVEDAFSSRMQMERNWREVFRMKEAIPKNPVRNFPIENAPNLVVPVGEIASDVFYSTSLQQIFTIDPLITVKQVPGRADLTEHAKAMQDWNNWAIRQEFRPRAAADHAFLDAIDLGTCAYYVPWIRNMKKTRTHTVNSAHPQIFPHPIEDVLVQGGAFQDLQQLPWVGLRFWMTWRQLQEQEIVNKWNIDETRPSGNVGWVRTRREQVGRTWNNTNAGVLFEIFELYVYWDIDGDGLMEDLLVTWDRTSRSILKIRFNPYDRRPIEHNVYSQRSYLFYGKGLLEKLIPVQDEISDIHNQRNLNMLLANTRIWKVRKGSGIDPNQMLWPGKQIEMTETDDMVPEVMADVYPSSPQAEGLSMTIAERITGINELNAPRPANLLSSRTPATTAQIGANQQSARFAGPFDQLQSGLSRAIMQCNYRYQERVLTGDADVISHVRRVMKDRAPLILEIYRDKNFDEGMSMELTATSQRQQREIERQHLIQLGTILIQYYERIIQLGSITSNPQTPAEIREIAKKVAQAAGEWVERITRTFDQIRDPKAFIVEMEEDINSLQALASADTFLSLQNLLSGMDALEQRQQSGQDAFAEGAAAGP